MAQATMEGLEKIYGKDLGDRRHDLRPLGGRRWIQI
jgi:hypothetical protein